MPVRHYQLDYSTDNGSAWTMARADEVPGPNKTLDLSHLSEGTYNVKLRLVPKTGESPIVSDTAVMTVGTPVPSENVGATSSTVITLADIAERRDALLAAANVVVSGSDLQEMNEALLAAAGASASLGETYQSAAGENVEAVGSAVASESSTMSMQEQLSAVTVSNSNVAVVAVMLNQVQATIAASAAVSGSVIMTEVVNAVAGVVSSESHVYTPGVSAPTQPVISATGGDTAVTIALTSGGVGATSYDLKWGTSAGSRPNTITGVTLPYTHTGRTNGATYYYSLVAVNAGGSAESAEVSAATAAVSAPVTLSPTLDGYVESRLTGTGFLWPDAKSATTGTLVNTAGTTAPIASSNYTDPEYGDNISAASRVFLSFAIPSDAINSAVLKMVVTNKTAGTFSLCVQKSTHGSTLELTDVRAFSDADPVFATVSVSATGSCDFTFNAAGLTYLNSVRGGTAYFVIRNYTYDYQSNTPPEGTGEVYCALATQENATEANRPKLVLN